MNRFAIVTLALSLVPVSNLVQARELVIRYDQGIGYGIPQAPSAAPWYGPRRGVNIAPTARVQRLGQGFEAPANGCTRPAFEAVSGRDRGSCYGH